VTGRNTTVPSLITKAALFPAGALLVSSIPRSHSQDGGRSHGEEVIGQQELGTQALHPTLQTEGSWDAP
jgi:hypothetical protein